MDEVTDMNTLDCIRTRRSIRKYTGQPIDDDQLKTVLTAAFQAPTANNLRPWEFIIVRSPNALQHITSIHPYAKMLPEAGCGILVCGDKNINAKVGYLTEDCSAAIQNILLAAHDIGLGTVWLGIHPREERIDGFRKLFQLPEHIVPIGMVAIGHSAESKEAPDRYDPSKIHMEVW